MFTTTESKLSDITFIKDGLIKTTRVSEVYTMRYDYRWI